MSLNKKIKHAGKWQSLSVISKNVIQVIYFAIMTRLLMKADYGLMAIINGLVGIGNIFVQGGMGSALIQRKEINNRHINGALQTSLLIGTIIYAIFYFTAPSISVIYEDIRLELLIKVASLNLILLSINNISVNLLQKNYLFKSASLVNIISIIIGYGIGVVLAFNEYGVWSLVIATLVSSLIGTVALFYFAPIKISFRPCLQEARELFGFGSGMILLYLSNFLSNKGLNLIFGKVFPTDILGVYERTSALKSLPSGFLSSIINKVMFPVMSEIQDENEKLLNIYKFGLGVSNSIMVPTTVFLIFFSPEIVQILMGPNWSEAVLPLQIMFLILTFSNSGSMTDSIIRAKGLIYKNVSRKYIFTVIIIILSGTLGYFYGINGAAVGIVVSHIINYLMMIILVKNVFGGSVKEYFYQPLVEGLKLGGYIGILIFTFKLSCTSLVKTNVTLFIIFTISLLLSCLVLMRYKPMIFGSYLGKVIKSSFGKG